MLVHKTYKQISILLALLIFFSSSGLAIDVHFCNGDFKRMNIFGKAKTCAEVATCSMSCGSNTQDKVTPTSICSIDDLHIGCCENQTFELNLEFEASELISSAYSSLDQSIKGVYYVKSPNEIKNNQNYSHGFITYLSPPLIPEIQILYQTFLI